MAMESIVDTRGSVIPAVGLISPQLLLINMQMTTSSSVTSSQETPHPELHSSLRRTLRQVANWSESEQSQVLLKDALALNSLRHSQCFVSFVTRHDMAGFTACPSHTCRRRNGPWMAAKTLTYTKAAVLSIPDSGTQNTCANLKSHQEAPAPSNPSFRLPWYTATKVPQEGSALTQDQPAPHVRLCTP